MTTPFQQWYAKNKIEFNAARKLKRVNDPEYAKKQQEYKKKEPAYHPPGGIRLTDFLAKVPTSLYLLTKWQKLGCVPNLAKFNGVFMVNEKNVPLAQSFFQFIEKKPDRQSILDMGSWLKCNWVTLKDENAKG